MVSSPNDPTFLLEMDIPVLGSEWCLTQGKEWRQFAGNFGKLYGENLGPT